MTACDVSLRIVHSSVGKFHHQDLARQLYRRGVLHTYFTGYPRFKLTTLGVPWDKVDTFPWLVVPYHGGMRYGLLKEKHRRALDWVTQDTFDRHVATNMPGADLYIGLSCASLHAGRAMQRHGGVYVCDRGSSHIRYQDRILMEEYDRQKIPYVPIDSRVVAKEEEEYETADAILVPSEFAFQSFIAEGVSPSKLRKVPYGVDLGRFSQVASPSSDHFDVLFVGAVSVRKGLPDLLSAYTQLQHPYKRLHIVGSIMDELKPLLQKYQKNDTSIMTYGPWPQQNLRDVMSRSHVLVLSSIEEGLALVMAQAMACGCPVIASEHTGARDLFTDGREGFVVPIRDPEAIAECLQRLADDLDRRHEMSEAALRRVRFIGGWNEYGNKILETSLELVHGKTAH